MRQGDGVANLLKLLANDERIPEAMREARHADADVETLMLESPLPDGMPSATPISPTAIDLIVASEVSSRASYEKKLIHPTWPRDNSGVTIGIGYDVGTVAETELTNDWAAELDRAVIARSATACRITGLAAADLASKLADISIPWKIANAVFLCRSIPVFVGITEESLSNTALLDADCLGALVSLVYNRGPSFARPEDRFREMRAIRDHMADRAYQLIPGELRSMNRIWQGDPDMAGLSVRREAEAQLFELGLADLPNHSGTTENVAVISLNQSALECVFAESIVSWVGGWLKAVIEEPTRNQLLFQLSPGIGTSEKVIRPDENYVAIRMLSARVVNARRWTSLYYGALHATCNMLYEGVGDDRIERQVVLAPDGIRDLDPKFQGKLLQIDLPVFDPVVYRGGMRLTIALFSVKSSDLTGPFLLLISESLRTTSLGFLAAAQPFVAPLSKATDLLFGTSHASSLECGLVRGFDPLQTGTWVCIGATRRDIPNTNGFHSSPDDNRLLDRDGHPIERYPYFVFRVVGLESRDNWMEIPGLKSAWDLVTTALVAGRDDDARSAAKSFRRLCIAGGDLTQADAERLADKADQKVAQALGAPRTESVPLSLRSLKLYDSIPGSSSLEDVH